MNSYVLRTANYEELTRDWRNSVQLPYSEHLWPVARLFDKIDGYLPQNFVVCFTDNFTAKFEIIEARNKYRDSPMYVLLRYLGQVD